MWLRPLRNEAVLSSSGMWTGTFMPVSWLQPIAPLPAIQPGGTHTIVSGPASCNTRRSTSSPPQPWQAETPGDTMSGRVLSVSM